MTKIAFVTLSTLFCSLAVSLTAMATPASGGHRASLGKSPTTKSIVSPRDVTTDDSKGKNSMEAEETRERTKQTTKGSGTTKNGKKGKDGMEAEETREIKKQTTKEPNSMEAEETRE